MESAQRVPGEVIVRLTGICEDLAPKPAKVPGHTPPRSSLRVAKPEFPREQTLVDGGKLVKGWLGFASLGIVSRSRKEEVVLPSPEMPVPATLRKGGVESELQSSEQTSQAVILTAEPRRRAAHPGPLKPPSRSGY